MVRSYCNVTKMVQATGRHNRIYAAIVFWTVIAVLSMSIIGRTGYAQNQSINGGGALGSLLGQLQTLKDEGAIDALEGRSPSKLNVVRKQGSGTIEEVQKSITEKGYSLSNKVHRQLTPEQLSFTESFCRGEVRANEKSAIREIRQFSSLEKDYCQRAGELLFQYGYDLFDRPANLDALDAGTIFPDYVLGIDDEIVVTFLGRLNQSFNARVDREGRLLLPNFKPILAAGHTFGEVRQEITARVGAKYLGTDVFVSFGAVRLVNVLVLGEVHTPGLRQLTAFNTLTDAIRLMGGVKKTGSVRRIHLQRGDQIFWLDAYDLLFAGLAARELTLRNGDRIIVPPLGPTYALAGDVRRPGIYEMPDGRRHLTLAEALQMSGGTVRPHGNLFHHLSFQETGHQELNEHKNLAAKVQNGDIIRVSRSQNIQMGAVFVDGHVHVPGRRALLAVPSVSALLGDVTSLQSDPYLLFAALKTTDPQTQARRLFPINLKKVLHGQEDYALRDNDRLIVLGAKDVQYLSSADIQEVVSSRIDADLKQQNPDEEVKIVAKDTASLDSALSGPVSAIQKAIAASKRRSNGSEDNTPEAKIVGKNVEKGLPLLCAGLRQLLAIVAVNSANRFANAIRTIDSAGLARLNQQSCPGIFDQFSQLLALALEHTVAIKGEVRHPGAYPIVGNVSLTDLIAVAGGLSREVDLTRVEISRYTPNAVKGSSDTARGLVNLVELGADKVMIGPGDVIRFNPVATDRDAGPILLVGEFMRPGLYEIRRGERLSEVIARAGGLTPQAYPYGGIFTRKRVQSKQRAGLARAARELNSALAVVAVQRNVNPSSILALRNFAGQLGSVEALGRIVTETDPTVLQVRPELDAVLEPGDRLYIPKRPNFVTVVGDVLNPGALQFIAGTTANEYIRQAGGFQRSADQDRVFVVYPNGRAEPLAVSVWNYNPVQVPPGSSLVVPKNPAPLDLFTLVREGSSLLGQLAVTAASLAVISRD